MTKTKKVMTKKEMTEKESVRKVSWKKVVRTLNEWKGLGMIPRQRDLPSIATTCHTLPLARQRRERMHSASPQSIMVVRRSLPRQVVVMGAARPSTARPVRSKIPSLSSRSSVEVYRNQGVPLASLAPR